MTENFDFTTKIVENIGLPALIYVAIHWWKKSVTKSQLLGNPLL